MKREKKICFCFTAHRIVLLVLLVTSLINLMITGAVVEAATAPPTTLPPPSATQTSLQSPLLTLTGFAPTATAFETFTPAATVTEPATLTMTATHTATVTPTPTQTASPVPIVCVKKSYWPYVYVQPNDTLYSLALATGSTVNELMQANCLSDTRIYPKQLLYVPRLPVPTITPTTTSVPTVFKDPYGEVSLCYYPPAVAFSVSPSDPDGIKVVTVVYNLDGGPAFTSQMKADGVTYYASGSLSEKEAKAETLYYYFIAVDGRGNYEYSLEYKVPVSPCPFG